MSIDLQLSVNGQMRSTHSPAERSLLDVLREDFDLTGTKFGCGEGECGACTVLVDGRPTRACVTPVGQVVAAKIETVESLASADELHPVQQAFMDQQAMQCGYCIPGHMMTAVALARSNPQANRAEIIEKMSEHICRCCNYRNILAAVELYLSNQAAR